MDTLLIIANSGRMLAQAACDAGFKAVVIDCFADVDTQALAIDSYQVESLAISDIKAAIEPLKSQFKTCIYGSGFETYQQSLFFLAEHFQLLGNSAEIFLALHNKADFFQRLQQLDICFPTVSFSTPLSNNKYLKKPFDSQGGLNIQVVNKHETSKHPRYYYQAYLEGQTLSALFVSDGKQASIIGFNRQWTEQHGFVFSGIINHTKLSANHQKILQLWVDKLTASYDLLGLCSLDFIVYKNNCYVLEINPRPPASMQLYGKNILTTHIKACQGQLEDITHSKNKTYTAYQIIYAPSTIQIPNNMEWLSNCCDLPQVNAIISKGQPICSMIVSGKNPQRVLEDLQQKQTHFLFTLKL